jgi:hypothetical protein
LSTDVSEEHIASIFRVEKISSAGNQRESRWHAGGKLSGWFPAELIFLDPEDGGDMFLRNMWLTLNRLHGVISQKIVLFMVGFFYSCLVIKVQRKCTVGCGSL